MYPGTDEGDYYRGAVTEAAPGTVRQVAVSKGETPGDAEGQDGGQVTVPGGSAPAGSGEEA
jgi:NADH-quinone oxidoreductase subunit I